MQNLIKHLNKSYPITVELASSFRIIIIAGLFVGVFMLFFKPFGLSNINVQHSNLFLLGYGFVTAFVLFLNLILIRLFFKKLFSEENWTVLKNILWLLWIVSTIGFANFIYTSTILSFSFGLKGIIYFQIYTLIVGAIPVTIITLIAQNNSLKKNIKGADSINRNIDKQENQHKKDQKVNLFAENGKDNIELDLPGLLFIESSGNYAEVNYLKNNILKTKLLRSSLKKINDSINNYPNLFKSHRAFIINLNNIIDVKGNAQGYQISLRNIDRKVPVSRNYIKEFKKIIN